MLIPLAILLLATNARAEPITPKQGISGIKDAIQSGQKKIYLSEGTFLLPETWTISEKFNGVQIVGVGIKTVLSGARETGLWELIDKKQRLWRCKSPLNNRRPVRQMFLEGGERMQRSRMPNKGWFRGDRLSTINFDVNRVNTREVANEWRTTRPFTFAGLRYRNKDANDIRQLEAQPDGAILQTISAWTSAWQPVRRIDHASRDIQLYTPSRYPLAHWSYGVNEGGGTPFAVENTLAGINLDGEWYWNPNDNTITLKFESDPNTSRFLVAALDTVLRIDGVENLKFHNLQIAHSRTSFGRYDQHKDWHGAIKKWDETFPDAFPQGLTVPQSAPFTGEAIHICNSRNIQFVKCRVSSVGGYAMRLSSNSHGCVVENCTLIDLGAGGINIDPELRKIESDYPSGNIIRESTISYGGRLHPAACAIRIVESAENRILNNRISHFGYTGISVGWAWNPRPNHTTGNHIIGNDISHVMEVLSDGAGIYTLGSIPGTRIEGNHVHDIFRAKTAVGAGNSGIFFDQFSKGAVVRNNQLTNIHSWTEKDKRESHPFKHHRNLPSDHTFVGNTVDGEFYIPISD